MKRAKTQNNKKMVLIILIVMLFNFILPTYSNGFMTRYIYTSIISKPLSSLIILILDTGNAALAATFALDDRLVSDDPSTTDVNEEEEHETAKEELENAAKTENGIFNRIMTWFDEKETACYNFLLSPDDIFSGKVQIANANIFSEAYDENGAVNITDWNLFNHLLKQLKQTIAGLYYNMRNLAAVILLCLLIYSSIRIVLASANPGEKSKWQMYLMDWLKALALVMFIHIIMIGIFYIADVVTDGLNGIINNDKSIVTQIRKNFNDTSFLDVAGVWIYIIMYGYITYMTIVFLIAYFKRLFYVLVLVIVAPVVSALYALGKTTKASFGRWFQEFVMGVMIQPFHLLIYSILIGLPMQAMKNSGLNVSLAGVDVWSFSTIDVQLYALIAISMIRPIEKYMRKLFGFGSTILDNVASFESGKKTVDAGVKVVKEVAKTAVMIGATVATAGAAAPAAASTTAASTTTTTATATATNMTGPGGMPGLNGMPSVNPELDGVQGTRRNDRVRWNDRRKSRTRWSPRG